jgi:hypothetical protein
LQLSGVAVAGAAMAGAFGMLMAAVDVAGGIDKSDIGPSTAAAFHHSTDVFFVCAELAAILPPAAVAIVAWRAFPALVGGPQRVWRRRARRRPGRLGGADLRAADLDARDEPVRPAPLARAGLEGGDRDRLRSRNGRRAARGTARLRHVSSGCGIFPV